MQLHELSPHPKAKRPAKRVGRGIGSGIGKTSTRGTKGQNSRSGGGVRVGFEGGQMPLARRLPKRGFVNNFAKEYSCVNVGALSVFKKGDVITAQLLKERGILSKIEPYGLKILGNGELSVSLTVQANAFTQQAKTKIESVGGKVVLVEKDLGSKEGHS